MSYIVVCNNIVRWSYVRVMSSVCRLCVCVKSIKHILTNTKHKATHEHSKEKPIDPSQPAPPQRVENPACVHVYLYVCSVCPYIYTVGV